MALIVALQNKVAGKFSSSLDVGTVDYDLNLNLTRQFTDGTGINQANMAFTDTRTIGASSSEQLDFAGGLTDAFGQTITFTSVKAIIIKAAAGNTNNVVIEESAANGIGLFGAAGDNISIKPNGVFQWVDPTAAGLAVTAGTGDLLDVANSGAGTGVDYTIVVIGTA